MTANALIDVREELNAKSKALGDIFEAAKGADGSIDFTKVEGHGLDGDQKARVERVQQLHAEINDLAKQAEEYADVKAIEDHASMLQEEINGKRRSNSHAILPGGFGAGENAKSLGELFTSAEQVKNFVRNSGTDSQVMEFDLAKDLGGGDLHSGVKTLLSTTAGWAPEAVRTGRLVDYATRPVQITDMLPSETTDQSSVVYMETTTWTNNAAEGAEGGTYGEAAFAFTERTSPVRKIGVWIPVTDEQLEDVSQLQSYINNQLGFMVRQRLDGQVYGGDGIAPNLEGISVRSGVQTQAKGADTVLDAIYKARTKVRVTGRAVPNALMIHPNDLQDIALTRTADGIYILGNPDQDGGLQRIWGLRVIETDAATENTALVGDTTYTGLAIKRNLTMQISNSHSTFFVEGKQAIRADLRAALQVYRPAAFCKVTGI